MLTFLSFRVYAKVMHFIPQCESTSIIVTRGQLHFQMLQCTMPIQQEAQAGDALIRDPVPWHHGITPSFVIQPSVPTEFLLIAHFGPATQNRR